MSQTQEVRGVATSIRTENGWTIIRYHSTDVVKFNDKQIILDSGGWLTATTKTRMNQAANQFDLGFHISQRNFKWFVVDLRIDHEALDFQDGMTINR